MKVVVPGKVCVEDGLTVEGRSYSFAFVRIVHGFR